MVGPMNLESLGSGMSFWASAPESGPMEITEKKVSKTKINKDKQISVVSAESAHFRRINTTQQKFFCKTLFKNTSVVDSNTLNLDPDLDIWPNLDPNP